MTLHPQAQAFVRSLAEQDGPGWHELSPTAGRAVFSSLIDLFGEKVELADVGDLMLVDRIPARIYRPVERGVLPALVWFHGGGWVLGNTETHDALCRQLASAANCCVVSVEYRLSPEAKFPLPLDDCYDATRALASRADELQIDLSQMSVGGDSAGGNLAAAVSLRARDTDGPHIKSQVLLYPVVQPKFDTDSYREFADGYGLTRATMTWFWAQYLDHTAQDQVVEISPYADLLQADLAGLPRTQVLTAAYDVLRDEGELLADRLQQAGVSVSRKRYEGMVHGFTHMASLFDDAQIAIQDIATFLGA